MLCSAFPGLLASDAWVSEVPTVVAAMLVDAIFAKLAVPIVHVEFLTRLWAAMRGGLFLGGRKDAGATGDIRVPCTARGLRPAAIGFTGHASVAWSIE